MPAPLALIPMLGGLFTGLGALVASNFVQAAARVIAKYGFIVFVVGTWITMFVALLAGSIAAVKAVVPAAPQGIAFALGLMPPETPYIYSTYFTTLVAKRLYDYYVQRSKQLFHV